MRILGIDPGPKKSGWALWDADEQRVVESESQAENEKLELHLYGNQQLFDALAVERVSYYGKTVGADVFETAYWSGRFAANVQPEEVVRPKFSEIAKHFCGRSQGVNESVVARAIRDAYGEKGTKKEPGPFYGVSGHAWSAVAVAIYAAEQGG